jgi:2-hydroxy-6-oxo-6-(2'-carboxyphenyl)-hexa-2,4-dienoate hydrolase
MKLSRSFLERFAKGMGTLLLLLSTTSYSAVASGTQSWGESKFVDVDGIRTRYFEAGSGEAMLLVHGGHYGMTGSALGWMPVFTHLAAHFNVFAIDKLGMGLTDKPGSDEEYTMQATVQHLYRFMETLGIGQVHLVGHSRGALPVARIAIDHPELVKTLIIFDTNTLAPGDPPARGLNLPSFDGSPPTAESKESIRQRALSRSSTFHKDFVIDEYVEASFETASKGWEKMREVAVRFDALRKRFIELNPEKVQARPALANNSGTGWWLYEVKDETLAAIKAGRLKPPTQIIWGFNDPTGTSRPHGLGMELFELISKSVDQAQLHFINLAGHAPYRLYPREVTNLIVSFTGSVKDLTTN